MKWELWIRSRHNMAPPDITPPMDGLQRVKGEWHHSPLPSQRIRERWGKLVHVCDFNRKDAREETPSGAPFHGSKMANCWRRPFIFSFSQERHIMRRDLYQCWVSVLCAEWPFLSRSAIALDLPLLHAVGLPALGQDNTAHNGLPSQRDIIIRTVPIEISTKTTDFILQAFANADLDDIEAIVVDLDVWAGVNDQEALDAVDLGWQASHKRDAHLGPVHLVVKIMIHIWRFYVYGLANLGNITEFLHRCQSSPSPNPASKSMSRYSTLTVLRSLIRICSSLM